MFRLQSVLFEHWETHVHHESPRKNVSPFMNKRILYKSCIHVICIKFNNECGNVVGRLSLTVFDKRLGLNELKSYYNYNILR